MSVDVLMPRTTTTAMTVTEDLYRMFLGPSEEKLVAPTAPVARLTAHSAPVGCKLNGVTRSVIVLAGVDGRRERLHAAMQQTKYAASVAKRNGNRMSYVFLGGALPAEGVADEGVLSELVEFRRDGSVELGVKPEDVHLIVGAREMQALAAVAESSPPARVDSLLWEYLRNSVFVECLGPPSMPDTGEGGIWLKAISTYGVVGVLPGIGVAGADGEVRAQWIPPGKPLALIPWKNEVNRRWREATADPWKCKADDASVHRWRFWMALAADGLRRQDVPFQPCDECPSRDSIAVSARETVAFGAVRRPFTVDAVDAVGAVDAVKPQRSCGVWLDVGAKGDSLYYAVLSNCGSTKTALAAAHKPPPPDRSMDAAELQCDVSITLSSLVQHDHRVDALAVPTHPYAVPEQLVGLIGPVVLSGRENAELLRVVQFSTHGANDVVVLLPELYVQMVLQRHHQEPVAGQRGARAVAGFLVLRDEDVIDLKVPNVCASEQADAAAAMGTRIWRMPPTREPSVAVAKAMASAEAKVAGSRVASPPGVAIFFTATDAMDPLAGLRVRWAFAPGSHKTRDLPTLMLV